MPLQVAQGTQRALPFDRVMYVLDVSGSMSGELAKAIRVTGVFGSDDSKVAVVTFNDSHSRWGGVRESCATKHAQDEPHGRYCLEEGWAFMPKHNQELMTHLSSFSGTGGTNPTSALDYAVKNAPEGTLIVFVSDGDFTHGDVEVDGTTVAGPVSAFRAAQAWRQQNQRGAVQMLVWAIDERSSKRESMIELAKVGGGGLWRPDVQRSGPW